MICKEKEIEVNGKRFWFQEFREPDNIEFNLYDENGDFIEEFDDWDAMMKYAEEISKTFH